MPHIPLPAELTDSIIGFLQSEKQALASCSLVCKDWLPASRHHYFETIYITTRNVRSFIDLLDESPSSTIANHVLHLEIGRYDHQVSIFTLIMPYLERFTAIVSLHLLGNKWSHFRDSWEERKDKHSRMSGRFMAMDLTGIMSHYEFGTFELAFSLDDSSNDDSNVFLSRLNTLLSVVEDKPGLSWLVRVAPLPAITDIILFDIPWEDAQIFRTILQTRGPSIRSFTLTLQPPYHEGIDEISDCIDLSKNTNLRVLSISGFEIQTDSGLRSISKIISQISSSSLTSIEIGLWTRESDIVHHTHVDWRQVAKVSSQPRFSKLRRVVVEVICEEGDEEDCRAWIYQEMSSQHKFGDLSVRVR